MNPAAIRKPEIIKQLSRAPENGLDKIRMCIESVLTGSTLTGQRSHSLKGIWKGKGFDKLEDLEGELREARKELGDSILKGKP